MVGFNILKLDVRHYEFIFSDGVSEVYDFLKVVEYDDITEVLSTMRKVEIETVTDLEICVVDK